MFNSVIEQWLGFYGVLSQVSATFAGLLFVSLSLRYDLLNKAQFICVKRLAQHTFKAFLFLVIFSLIFMIPKSGIYGVTIPLCLVAIYAFILTLRAFWAETNQKTGSAIRINGARGIYMLSLLTYLMFIVVSVLLFLEYYYALYFVVGLVIWHLALVTSSSWKLLLELKS